MPDSCIFEKAKSQKQSKKSSLSDEGAVLKESIDAPRKGNGNESNVVLQSLAVTQMNAKVGTVHGVVWERTHLSPVIHGFSKNVIIESL